MRIERCYVDDLEVGDIVRGLRDSRRIAGEPVEIRRVQLRRYGMARVTYRRSTGAHAWRDVHIDREVTREV